MRTPTLVACLVAALVAQADVVVRKDGARQEGRIVEESLTLRTAEGRTLKVPLAEVRRVEMGEPAGASATAARGVSLQELVQGEQPKIDARYERDLQYALYATDASTEVILAAARKDPRLSVRTAAIAKLAVDPREEAHTALLALLADREPKVQLAVVQALQKRNDPRAIDSLLSTLQRTQEEVADNPLLGLNPASRAHGGGRASALYRQKLSSYYRDKEQLAGCIERAIAQLRNTADRMQKEKRRGGL